MDFVPHFYVGPWHWATSVDPDRSDYGEWVGPSAEYWAIDYRATPACAIAGGSPGNAIFVTRGPVGDAAYTLLGSGDWRDIKSSQRLRDAVPRRSGVTLDADDLCGLIFQSMMTGDPSGEDFARNLGVGTGRQLRMRYGPLDFRQAFSWDASDHRSAVRDKLRYDLRQIVQADRAEAAVLRSLAAAITGLTWQQVQALASPVVVANRSTLRWAFERGATPTQTANALTIRAGKLETHYRRVMGTWLNKFGIDASRWLEFVPTDMRGEVDPPLVPETTLSETFNQSDSSTVGPTYSWTEYVLDWSTVSNYLKDPTGFSTTASIRADSDLSGDDHYCQADVTFDAVQSDQGEVSVRFNSSAHSCYCGGGNAVSDVDRIYKITTGTRTQLASQAHTIGAETLTTKLTVGSGGDSNLDLLVGVSALSTTDSTFTGQTRCGCSGIMVNNSARNHRWDNWVAADLVAASAAVGRGLLVSNLLHHRSLVG